MFFRFNPNLASNYAKTVAKSVNKLECRGTYRVEARMSMRSAAAPFLGGLAQLVSVRRSTARPSLEDQVTRLFDQFRGPLLRYLSVFRLNPADAEDIIQDVFLALFRRLKGGGPVENTAGWIFGAAHNLGLRQATQVRKKTELEQSADIIDIVDGCSNPEDLYAGIELSRRLWSVVDSLPDTDRQCIFLRSEGLRYREIAMILDISLGAVALSLSRSLARIARCAERCTR